MVESEQERERGLGRREREKERGRRGEGERELGGGENGSEGGRGIPKRKQTDNIEEESYFVQNYRISQKRRPRLKY